MTYVFAQGKVYSERQDYKWQNNFTLSFMKFVQTNIGELFSHLDKEFSRDNRSLTCQTRRSSGSILLRRSSQRPLLLQVYQTINLLLMPV